jgi:predicted metal-dependent phosphoesterase TrpH
MIPHSATALIDCAAALGYHALAITLHERQLNLDAIRDYAASRGVLLIPGVERTIGGKHVLLINFTPAAETVTSFEQLAALKQREADGLVIAPHPFYPHPNCLGTLIDRHAAVIDAVEVNGMYARGADFNKPAIRWATRHGKPLVGNCDVHRLAQLGTTYSLIDAECDPRSICHAIRAGRVRVETTPLTWFRTAALLGDIFAGEARKLLNKLRRASLEAVQ